MASLKSFSCCGVADGPVNLGCIETRTGTSYEDGDRVRGLQVLRELRKSLWWDGVESCLDNLCFFNLPDDFDLEEERSRNQPWNRERVRVLDVKRDRAFLAFCLCSETYNLAT